MTIARTLCALVMAAAVASCESGIVLPKSGGTYADAQAGNRLESRIGKDKGNLFVTAAGTLLGPFLGSDVGRSLDVSDRRYAEYAARKSLETAPAGMTSNWSNPETGHSGTFTPANVYRSADDLLCRDYVQGVSTEGLTKDTFGTACRTKDGLWRVAFGNPVRRAARAVRSSSSPNNRR